jgi:hypothetical protein
LTKARRLTILLLSHVIRSSNTISPAADPRVGTQSRRSDPRHHTACRVGRGTVPCLPGVAGGSRRLRDLPGSPTRGESQARSHFRRARIHRSTHSGTHGDIGQRLFPTAPTRASSASSVVSF